MSSKDVLELDYLVEEFSNDTVTISKDPSGGNVSESYVSVDRYVFDPPQSGTYELEIDGQTIQVDVADIVDDFEDGNISEYNVYDAQSVSVGATTSNPFGGSYSFEYNANTTATNPLTVSTSGLSVYPMAGDTFEFYMKVTDFSQVITYVNFGVSNLVDSTDYDGYRVDLVGRGNNKMRILKKSGTNFSTLASGTADWSLYNNEWLRGEVQWGDSGSMTCLVEDSTGSQINSITGTDSGSSYTSGGIGIGAAYANQSTANVYVDLIRII